MEGISGSNGGGEDLDSSKTKEEGEVLHSADSVQNDGQ
jgi:hypothetical protein